ncbi:hypothetical protein JZ751_007773, partial [Albula glossodonta]
VTERKIAEYVGDDHILPWKVQELTPEAHSQCPIMAGTSIYDFTVETLEGQPISLSAFRGKVLLIVNVATF